MTFTPLCPLPTCHARKNFLLLNSNTQPCTSRPRRTRTPSWSSPRQCLLFVISTRRMPCGMLRPPPSSHATNCFASIAPSNRSQFVEDSFFSSIPNSSRNASGEFFKGGVCCCENDGSYTRHSETKEDLDVVTKDGSGLREDITAKDPDPDAGDFLHRC